MNPFAIIMFFFAELLFVASALLYRGHTGWLYSFKRSSVKDEKEYAKFLAVCVIGCGLAALAASAVSLFFGIVAGAAVLVAGIIAVLIAASKKAVDFYK